MRFIERPMNPITGSQPKWLLDILSRRISGDADAFLNLNLSQLPSPFLLPEMNQAVDIVIDAINNHKKILCVVDYDTDGVCSGSVLYEGLINMGANVEVFVTNRHEDGYGLSVGAVNKIKGNLPDLIITADLGSSDGVQVELLQSIAKEQGVDLNIVITDHHHISETTPPKTADAFINPHRKDIEHDYHHPVCGAMVAWNLMAGVRNKLNHVFNIKNSLDLVAVATIGDMVDLSNPVNRIVTKFGLSLMNKNNRLAWDYIKSLKDIQLIDEEFIGFQISPRINALSRMGDKGETALIFMTSKDEKVVAQMFAKMSENNEMRKEDQLFCEEQAMIMAKDQVDKGYFALVCFVASANHGVVGLAAGKIAGKFGLPTLVMSLSDHGVTGSARSIPGYDIRMAIEKTQAISGIVKKYGGHSAAAGVSLNECDVSLFHETLNEVIKSDFNGAIPSPTVYHDGVIPSELLTLDNFYRLKEIKPFGMGFPSAVFVANAIVDSVRLMGKNNEHAKLDLDIYGKRVTAIWFNYPMDVVKDKSYHFAFNLSENVWNERRSLQLMVIGVENT